MNCISFNRNCNGSCGSLLVICCLLLVACLLLFKSLKVDFIVFSAPCCPDNLTVSQVTQAMTNVTWSPANGAQTYIASLSSPRGHAQCHTMETECVMGCITCGTNYTVSLEAISRTGHKEECTYHGFSASTSSELTTMPLVVELAQIHRVSVQWKACP